MVLVVGGAGYIGSHINKCLAKNGYNTIVLDNLSYGHHELVKWGQFILGDIGDKKHLRLIFKKYDIKAVMHFSAFAYVGESVTDPLKYYKNNLKNTLNLLEIMIEFGVNKFIFSSTCATYGVPDRIPIKETDTQNPINPYGESKFMVEKILKHFDSSYGLKSVILRYFNAAGADIDCEIGEWHIPETHLIPLILDTAIGKREYISIYGVDYPTKDGTCIRDYIHVTDLANAHRLALEYLIKNGESNIFNLGNGTGFSVREVIETAKIKTGINIKTIETERRAGDPPILIGDATKAKKILLWEQKYNDLSTIIETAWNWHKKII